MPPHRGIRVVRSPIHGHGLLATRAFQAGELVAVVDGVLVHRGDEPDPAFSLWLDGDWFLNVVDQTRWINHSCAPNVWFDAGVVDGTPWARLVALRDVEAGEELTSDYALDADEAIPCRCGARACGGWIVATGA